MDSDAELIDEFDDEMDMDVGAIGSEAFVEMGDEAEVNLELDNRGNHDDELENLGLSDGYESESFSEGDLMISGDEGPSEDAGHGRCLINSDICSVLTG